MTDKLLSAKERFDRGSRSIETAPRSGKLIWVGHFDVGRFPMRWDATFENDLYPGIVGFWIMDGFSWNEADGTGPDVWWPIDFDFGLEFPTRVH